VIVSDHRPTGINTIADTLLVPYRSSDSLAVKIAIRACDTVCSSFITTNTLLLTWYQRQLAAPPPPPLPPPVTISAVAIQPIALTLTVTDAVAQLFGSVARTDGTLTVGNLTWRSEDSLIAKVDTFGVVTPMAVGMTHIHARVGAVEASIPVTIRPSVMLSVERVRLMNVPSQRVIQVPTVIPGFPFVPLSTGGWVLNLINGTGDTVGAARCTVRAP